MGAAQTYQWAVTFPDLVLRMGSVLRVRQNECPEHCCVRGRTSRGSSGLGLEGRAVLGTSNGWPPSHGAGLRWVEPDEAFLRGTYVSSCWLPNT